jgi:hypothetical protein
VDSTEDDLEGARVTCTTALCKETTLVFSEYRNYDRIQLTTERGWDQYLPESPAAQRPVPVISGESSDVDVTAGQVGQATASSFFVRRSTTCSRCSRTCCGVRPSVCIKTSQQNSEICP